VATDAFWESFVHYELRWWLDSGVVLRAHLVMSVKLFESVRDGERDRQRARAQLEQQAGIMLYKEWYQAHPNTEIIRKRSYWEDPTIQ